ncbi:MAG: four helix bundle protein [Thermoguttaceae bacterium]|nr:four helix bundle protein [Thermoguttaceae bacterium]
MGGRVTRFEELEAWRAAREVVNRVYSICRRPPLSRDFGLCSQCQRAAVSIMTNIAEGFERVHVAEKLQFYNIARASTGEVRSLSYVVEDNYTNVADEVIQLRDGLHHLGRLITGLIRSTYQRHKS